MLLILSCTQLTAAPHFGAIAQVKANRGSAVLDILLGSVDSRLSQIAELFWLLDGQAAWGFDQPVLTQCQSGGPPAAWRKAARMGKPPSTACCSSLVWWHKGCRSWQISCMMLKANQLALYCRCAVSHTRSSCKTIRRTAALGSALLAVKICAVCR